MLSAGQSVLLFALNAFAGQPPAALMERLSRAGDLHPVMSKAMAPVIASSRNKKLNVEIAMMLLFDCDVRELIK